MAKGVLRFAIALATISSVALAPVPAGATSSNTQRQQYEDAAKSSKEGAKKDRILAGVWGLVTAYCLLPCAMPASFSAPACTYSSMGAAVLDAVITKQYASAISSIAGSAISLTMTVGKNADKDSKQLGACLAVATSGLQVFMKLQNAKNSDSTAETNEAQARALDSSSLSMGNASDLTGSKSGQKTAPPAGSGVAASADASNPCSVASTSSGVSAQISCAAATDSNIPSFVTHPNFESEFQKMTGKSASDFAKAVQNDPVGALSSIGGSAGPDATDKLGKVLASMQGYAGSASDLNSGMYAGGGGGGGSGGGGHGESGPDFNALMSGLMNQLNPQQEGKEEVPPGFNSDEVAQMRRSPAQVSENKSLSIFARISYRYYYVGKRLLYSDASQQQNAASPVTTGGKPR